MTDCSAPLDLGFHPERPLHVTFDAPHVSSDGGLLLLRQADERLGLSRSFSECLVDTRDPKRIEHSRHEQVRQRIFQIAMGYEDCNDADWLRRDPLLTVACDRPVADQKGLSSQPTLSRFEHSVTGGALNGLVRELERMYVDELPTDTTVVVLDIDTTDDPTHGAQQLTFFHGFYDQHMYHPLLVFDGQTGQLISVLLRPGNAHACRSAWALLSRVIRRIKARFPEAQVVVRGDSGFAMPHLMEKLEALDAQLGDIDYLFGIAKNSVLLAHAAPAIDLAREIYEQTGEHVRHFSQLSYSAKTWPRQRHVIVKAEHGSKGSNPRFVVTTLTDFPPRMIYDRGYCARGQAENYIKDFKNALSADRLSCTRFVANAFRLLLHAAAYRLLHAVRSAAAKVDEELGALQFDTLRLRLLKVAAQVTMSARRIWVRISQAFPLADAFSTIAQRLAPS
jgi:hypothetical protein